MSLLLEILANLENKPIETILTQFRDKYTKENAINVISELFAKLGVHTFGLGHNDHLDELRDEFFTTCLDIKNGHVSVTKFQPLVDDILQNQDEARVFTTAIELAQELGKKENFTLASDRPVRAPSNSRTTITHSNSEVSGLSKNVVSLIDALKTELNSNTIVDIDNFWEVLFLNKEWSDQTLKIWESYKAYESKEIKIQYEDTIRRPKKKIAMNKRKTIQFLGKGKERGLPVTYKNTRSLRGKDIRRLETGVESRFPETSSRTRNINDTGSENFETTRKGKLPETSRKTRSQTKQEAKNTETMKKGEVLEYPIRTRNQENKADEQSKVLGKDKSQKSSDNANHLKNTAGVQKQDTLPEDTYEEIPKKVYANQILREDMTEDEMWDWLEFFREKFLSQLTDQISKPSKQFSSIFKEREGTQLRSNYFRSKQCTMKGTHHKYQAEFLTKAIGFPNGTRHQWRDVRVLGEFSKQDDSIIRNEKFVRLSRLALEVFCAQPLRHFIHGFCAFKSTFELWVFNRSGAYGSGKLTLKDDKEKFVRAICSYLLMSDQELGIDSSIQQVNGRSFVSVCDKNLGKTQQFEINPYPFFTAGSLVTRGTTCFESLDQNAVVKYSWVRIPGESEIKFLQRSRGTEGVVEYIAADAICTIGDHLKDLNFSMAKYWNVTSSDTVISQGTGVQVPRTPMLKDRELRRIVVTPRGRSLRSSKTILEFLTGIRDTIEAHHRLYVDKKILHGDISDGNIILATVDGKMQGILIDLDHAENVGETGSKDEKLFLTGTMRFMALERLQYAANFKQTIIRTYHHDLESFFYIFILGCMTYERDKKSKVVSQLDEWSNGNVMKSYHAKKLSVLSIKEMILDRFSKNFEALKDLARELRMILFTNLPDDFSTYKDHDVEYEEVINAFKNTIDDIKEGRITDKKLVRGSS